MTNPPGALVATARIELKQAIEDACGEIDAILEAAETYASRRVVTAWWAVRDSAAATERDSIRHLAIAKRAVYSKTAGQCRCGCGDERAPFADLLTDEGVGKGPSMKVCPYLDHPEHDPNACMHCATDEQLERTADKMLPPGSAP